MAQAQMSLNQEQTYTQKLLQIIEGKLKCNIWNREKYDEILELIVTEPQKADKTSSYYYLVRKYEVLQCGDVKKIVKKRNSSDEDVKYYVCLEDMYSIVQKIHISIGHGGRDKMVKEANRKYANVSYEALELYKELCEECQLKKRRSASKGVVAKPIISKEFNSRGQVDLIDMQSFKYNDYRFLMLYQDHLTKFVILRPLTSKRAYEVAMQILDIFLLFGAPNILQSDNGAEFTANIISELKNLWPECKIVHGKPRHPQSQGSVE
ncbi:KRAB-A domain-containing protein 2-like [Mytilus edulis]|uniref:KRAB-A domain-containing protein 2-like n=1 Tax=Mytilus edulis TaxID=6550 RepID=UPI0039EF24D1